MAHIIIGIISFLIVITLIAPIVVLFYKAISALLEDQEP